jgi:DNA-binding response OmpR family regulator
MVESEFEHAAASPDPGEHKPTLLIAEDEFVIRASLSDYLQECGFKVVEASTAAEAIEIIKKSGVHFDLVFCDILMPGLINGLGLALWIRANRPALPILLTSGDPDKSAAAKTLCENEPFMPKPYDLEAVVARIRALIGPEKS